MICQIEQNKRLPCVKRARTTKSGEGERVTIKLVQIQSCAGSFRHAIACHLPPGGRLCCRPTVYLKGVTHHTLLCNVCNKRTENFHVLCPFVVGANCVRPRAFTERPYEFDFLSAGKTCFMEDTLWRIYLNEEYHMIYIIVAGSREFDDYSYLEKILKDYLANIDDVSTVAIVSLNMIKNAQKYKLEIHIIKI